MRGPEGTTVTLKLVPVEPSYVVTGGIDVPGVRSRDIDPGY